MQTYSSLAALGLLALAGCGLDFDQFDVSKATGGSRVGDGSGGDGANGSGGAGGDGSNGDGSGGSDGSDTDGGGGTGGEMDSGMGGDGGGITTGGSGGEGAVKPLTCKTAKCDPVADCDDDSGKVVCKCPDGYDDPDDDGKQCNDRDECKLGDANCHEDADCVNAEPGFVCHCKDGFNGDGVDSCKPNKLCVDAEGSNCAAGTATCTEIDEQSYCVCNTGYLGDGETCGDVDECADGIDTCTDTENCIDADGTFGCVDCLAPTDCNTPASECQLATCSGTNVCGVGNHANTMACATGLCDGQGSCKCRNKNDCPGATNVCIAGSCVPNTCGDGVTAGSETCDDSNTTTEVCAYGLASCTVCNASCQSVAGATARCGDSNINGGNGEQCDDGNTVTEACSYGVSSCTVCSSSCRSIAGATTRCGDTVTQGGNGEQCDDGNTTNSDGCKNNCQNNICGDLVLRTSGTASQIEECEVNVVSNGEAWTEDTCRNDCRRKFNRKCTSTSECNQTGAWPETCDPGLAMCTVYVPTGSECGEIPGYDTPEFPPFNHCAVGCLGPNRTCPKDLLCQLDDTRTFYYFCVGRTDTPRP